MDAPDAGFELAELEDGLATTGFDDRVSDAGPAVGRFAGRHDLVQVGDKVVLGLAEVIADGILYEHVCLVAVLADVRNEWLVEIRDAKEGRVDDAGAGRLILESLRSEEE